MSERCLITIGRLRKKLAQRDRRIAGLASRIDELESALALSEMRAQRLPIDVERAVQRALCNVRMIPVLGIGTDAQILEVATKPHKA